jgi:hypothetical protein
MGKVESRNVENGNWLFRDLLGCTAQFVGELVMQAA